LHHFFEDLGIELWSSVREEGVRKSELFVDIVLGGLDGVDCFVAGNRNYPLSRSMVDHDHEAVKFIDQVNVSDEVTCDLEKEKDISPSFNRNQAGNRGVHVHFYLLANSTAGYVVLDKNGHSRPPVVGVH
jgi:hypothetical protein